MGVRESTPTREQPATSENLRDDVQGNSEKSQTKQEMTQKLINVTSSSEKGKARAGCRKNQNSIMLEN